MNVPLSFAVCSLAMAGCLLCTSLLQLIFVCLRVEGAIDWSWMLVLIPTFVPVALAAISALLTTVWFWLAICMQDCTLGGLFYSVLGCCWCPAAGSTVAFLVCVGLLADGELPQMSWLGIAGLFWGMLFGLPCAVWCGGLWGTLGSDAGLPFMGQWDD